MRTRTTIKAGGLTQNHAEHFAIGSTVTVGEGAGGRNGRRVKAAVFGAACCILSALPARSQDCIEPVVHPVYAADTRQSNAVAADAEWVYYGIDDRLAITSPSAPAWPEPVVELSLGFAPTGIDIADGLVLAWAGQQLAVVDVSDPRSPDMLAITVLPATILSASLAAPWAIVLVDDAVSLRVIDLRNPADPVEAGRLAVGTLGDVDAQGSLAYVSADVGRLRVVDFSTPTNPVIVGSSVERGSGSVAVAGEHAYVADSSGLSVYDVSTPSAPRGVGRLDLGARVLDVAISGSLASLAVHYPGGMFSSPSDCLVVVDISSPASPVRLGRHFPGNNFLGGSDFTGPVAAAGRFAYGVRRPMIVTAYDLADPMNPQPIANLVEERTVEGVQVSGTRALLRRATVSTVLDISDPAQPQVLGHVASGDGWLDSAYVGETYAVSMGHEYDEAGRRQSRLRFFDIREGVEEVQGFTLPGGAFALGSAGSTALAFSPTGNHAGYLLHVFDASSPAAPVHAATMDLGATVEMPRGSMRADSATLFIPPNDSSFWATGARIIDVSNPSSPRLAAFVPSDEWNESGYAALGSRAVFAIGRRLCSLDRSRPDAEVAPTCIEAPAAWPESGSQLEMMGRYLYVLGDGYLRIFELREPFEAVDVSSLPIDGVKMWRAGSHLVLRTESDLRVLDVSDPAAPVEIDRWDVTNVWSDEVAGSHAYLVGYFLDNVGVDVLSLSACCTAPPSIPELRAPEVGASRTENALWLDWSDAPGAFSYDVYLARQGQPSTRVATDVPVSEWLVRLPAGVYAWSVVAKSGCGSTASAVGSFQVASAAIHRFESLTSLAARTPDRSFPIDGLPWSDPDGVLAPGAPRLLFYDVESPADESIRVVKKGSTVRIEAR